MLFGFSQGAQIALDLAAFGGFQLRGVVSIAGYMMEESEKDEPALPKTQTKVLVMQGDKDDMRTVKEAKEKLKHLERLFGQANVHQLIVDGMGHGMPNSEVKREKKNDRKHERKHLSEFVNRIFYSPRLALLFLVLNLT